jgi:hypothetical protein
VPSLRLAFKPKKSPSKPLPRELSGFPEDESRDKLLEAASGRTKAAACRLQRLPAGRKLLNVRLEPLPRHQKRLHAP